MRKGVVALLVLFVASAAYAGGKEETFQVSADRAYAAAVAAIGGEWRVDSTDAASRTITFHVGRGLGRDPQDGTVVVIPNGDQSCTVVSTTQPGRGGSV